MNFVKKELNFKEECDERFRHFVDFYQELENVSFNPFSLNVNLNLM
jgi:hypothetical protein